MNAAETITSPANPRIKQAAALRDADERRATGLTLVDGRRELARAAAAGVEIVEAFVDTQRTHDPATAEFGTTFADWIATLAAKGTRIATVSERPSSGLRSAHVTRASWVWCDSPRVRSPASAWPLTGPCS
jgi:tRNA G18 (ribose-2'-O)-methylase SpoU